MENLPKLKHHRRSVRLPCWDYSEDGYYFVTICTEKRKCMLGEIKEGKMVLSKFGKIVDREILNTPNIRNNIGIDIYQIMPNHIHLIIIIQSEGRGVMHYAPTQKLTSPSQTLGSVIRGIKSAITANIKKMTNNQNVIIWQRNYYEHVIRNNRELAILREYIENNPMEWEIDEENPRNFKL